ncbi:MAG TPA: hypothetical protein VHC95_10585 [Opitutales bacterium]|nr:hypothetical protein [Opitutales bacterium]
MIALAIAVLLYGVAYFLWYLTTPLGQAPQLDADENLVLAQKVAAGALAHEPFYRAMLYPALLALPLKLGMSADKLPALASLFGLLGHFLITLGVARLAQRLWVGPHAQAASCLAAALWGLNPVALYYSVQVLDTVPSLALAVWALVIWARPGTKPRDAMLGGILLGLAVAARPHFLPLIFFAPLLRSWFAARWKPQRPDLFAWAGALVVLLLLGGVQKWWGGEFVILPAQGPYNFYAANRPDANGRYYAQKIFFDEIAPGENPARKESEILYARLTGQPADPQPVMNEFWSQDAIRNIIGDPAAWLKLEFEKLYYLLNDYDQYNNQTYAWHRQNSPLLRWNYLGWGMLFVLAAGILALRGRGEGSMPVEFNCPIVAGVMLVFCVYSAGVLLYYASGRFRLPLLPLLGVLAGGWMAIPHWSAFSRRQILATPLALIFAAALTFSNFFAARDDSTFIQDELLAANAAAQIGDDAAAIRYASMALQRDPARPDARRILIISNYDFSLQAGDDSLAAWQDALKNLQGLPINDPALSVCAGTTYWKTGDRATALKIWVDGAQRFGPASTPAQALAAAHALGAIDGASFPAPDPQLVAFLKRKPD